jgi:hypothetical protein
MKKVRRGSDKQSHEERLVDSLAYDDSTGILTWSKPPRRGVSSGLVAGHAHSQGYLTVGFEGRVYFAHRLAWRLAHGAWPEMHIDHINGIKTDNRLCNLRDVSRRANLQNRRGPTRSNTSGWLGVRMSEGRYVAQIGCGGKTKYIGSFNTGEQAHAAYLMEKRRLHEGCTI